MADAPQPLLRTRRGLVFTAMPAIAVLAVLGALLAFAHHDSAVRDRHDETRALAAAAATNARRFVDDELTTLSAVAAAPAVREGRLRLVRPYLRTVARSGRFTGGVALLGPDGRVRAASRRLPAGGLSLAGRRDVRTVLDTGRASVSDVEIDPLLRLPVITFGYPVFDPAGTRDAAVVGSMRLDRLGEGLRRLLYAPGAGVTIVDGAGHVIAGDDPVQGLDRPSDPLPVAAMRRREHGLLDALATPDGTRLVGFSLVPGTGWLVVVDRSHDEVIGPLDTALRAEIAVLALLAVVGVMVTLNVGRRLDRLDAARDEALAEQRDIAVELQRSLLPEVPGPPSLDVHAAYAPAQGPMAVGGDWYDVVELDDGRVALTVGDVAGHGLVAAAAMGQLRSAARTLALGGAAPAAALGQLDRFTCTVQGSPLATTVFAVLDPASGELRYACAGHPPPLVVRAAGTTAFLRDGRSPLLGVDPPGARSEGRTTLATGDVLVIYTDGLIERPAHSLDEGMAALATRAAAGTRAGADATTLAETLLAGVEEPRRDDTAVLCVALLGAPDAAGSGPAGGDAQPSSVPS